MATMDKTGIEEEVARLYVEPIIGASYANTYGEENIKSLVGKYRNLNAAGMSVMREMVTGYSQSADLASSFVSVAVLHALGMNGEVEQAYRWAQAREDCGIYISHFDIGKSITEHLGLIDPCAGGPGLRAERD